MKGKPQKRRYTTYFFPSHFTALERIADVSGKNVTQVLSEALDTYLTEVGALQSAEIISVRKEDLKKRLEELERTEE